MNRVGPTILFVAISLASFSVRQAAAESPQPQRALDFARDVQPIFAEHCYGCHSGESPEGGLRLNDRQSATSETDSGVVAVVPGKPEQSELVRRITAADAAERMPPEGEKPLTADRIATLRAWIAQGALWGGHWAYQPLQHVHVPETSDSWAASDLDRFVLDKLNQRGWKPSPEADRYTLIKRLHYDLLGLPPDVAEVDRFVADDSPQAYESLVDRLLDSPHFGERWGRHWLDLAHYADSDGYEKDGARPDAYVYRDWVIEAINQDMPFDQFTIEQLAGDLLPSATAQQHIATGFLRQSLTNEEGGVDQEEFRVAANFDRTETLGALWLGLTIGCARCHAHKYDPLPHEDFYRLFAFFNDSDETEKKLAVAATNMAELELKLQPLQAGVVERERALLPQALAWEAEQHRRILSQPEGGLQEQPIEVVSLKTITTPDSAITIHPDHVLIVSSQERSKNCTDGECGRPPAEQDTYTVIGRASPGRLTGVKLRVEPDPALPRSGPGNSEGGNFVLSGFQLLHIDQHGQEHNVELHRPQADYSQNGFPAAAALQTSSVPKQGWAVGGKAGAEHWIQFRTREPLVLQGGEQLKFVIDQQYGARHTLGRFRLLALTGDERGLHLDDAKIADALEMYPEKRIAATKRLLFDYYLEQIARDAETLRLRKQVAELHKQHQAQLMDVRTFASPLLPRTTHVFYRGDFLSPRDEVRPAVPQVLGQLQSRGEKPDRLDLARWLVAPQNFSTPRVAVNHVWLHLFGTGLVRTANDFGIRGQAPTHPELLDWLAGRFQHDLGWSRKRLIREIVVSKTYRQTARFRPEYEAEDPLNTLLFRQNRWRVESEIVRDLHLAVSGLLSQKIGGPSVFPPMPEDLAKLSYANNFTWKNSPGADRYRRGMYTFFKRTIPHPNLMTFDSPDANIACPARTVSNTPLQALTLLNNEAHSEASQAFARRVLQTADAADDAARLSSALRACVARVPTATELAVLQRLLEQSRQYYRAQGTEAKLAVGQQAFAECPPAEMAAWVATVRVLMNLDEFITRE